MNKEFPSSTRSVWPFEESRLLGFIPKHEARYNDDPEEVKQVFRGLVSELFDEINPRAVYEEPYIPHILTFRLDSSGGLASDGCAEIVIQVEKQGRNVDLSDRIIIQDRLLGETRNEYVYQSTDGPDGEIVRVCCGDIATLDRIYAKKGINVFENEASYVFANESERPISIAELEVIKDLTAMSEVVDSPAVRTKHKEYPYPDTFMPM